MKCFPKKNLGGCLDGDLCDPISCLVENGGALFSIKGVMTMLGRIIIMDGS